MARARNIKPGFFANEELVELPFHTRLLFIGLWTLCDRAGRMDDRPKKIKMALFPADDLNIDECLGQLQDAGFLLRYEIGAGRYIQVLSFEKHQDPHYKEKPSEIPAPFGHEDAGGVGGGVPDAVRTKVFERDGSECRECGATNDLSIDHIVPRSKGGSHEESNLCVLCRSCNSSKNNRRSSLIQRRPDVGSTLVQPPGGLPPLIPDSLIPDSLIPDSLTPAAPKAKSSDHSSEFEEAWAAYPRKGDTNKSASSKAWLARVKSGCDPKSIIDGVIRYAAYCHAMKTEQKYIKQPQTFFGPDRHFDSSWSINSPPSKSAHSFSKIDYHEGVSEDGTFG